MSDARWEEGPWSTRWGYGRCRAWSLLLQWLADGFISEQGSFENINKGHSVEVDHNRDIEGITDDVVSRRDR